MPLGFLTSGTAMGLGQGLSNFAAGVRQNRQEAMQQQALDQRNALAKRSQAENEINKGLIYNPDTNSFDKTEERQAGEQAATAQSKYNYSKLDPNDPKLAQDIKTYSSIFSRMIPNQGGGYQSSPSAGTSSTAPSSPMGAPLPEGASGPSAPQTQTAKPSGPPTADGVAPVAPPAGLLSGAQADGGGLIASPAVDDSNNMFSNVRNRKELEDRLSMLGTLAKTSNDMRLKNAMGEIAQYKAGLAGQGLALRGARLDLSRNTAIGSVQDKIENNPQITQNQTDLLRGKQDLSLLQSGQKITPQMVEDITAGYAQLLSGKGAATDTLRDSLSLDSTYQKLPAMLQKVTGKTLNGISPDQKEFLIDAFNRLNTAKEANSGYLAIAKRDQYPDQQLQGAHDQKIGQFAPGWKPGQNAQDWMNNYLKKNNGSSNKGAQSGKGLVPSSSAPKTGDIVKGYRFNGGDPSVQSNWSKQ